MADQIDEANKIADEHLARSLAAARPPIPAGEPGECEQCGEEMPRLVNGRCGYCRDGRRRPAKFAGEVLSRFHVDRDESQPGGEWK